MHLQSNSYWYLKLYGFLDTNHVQSNWDFVGRSYLFFWGLFNVQQLWCSEIKELAEENFQYVTFNEDKGKMRKVSNSTHKNVYNEGVPFLCI